MSDGFVILEIAARDLPAPHATEYCKTCPAMSTIGYLSRVIKANGSVTVRWVCNHCEAYDTAGDLPHSLVTSRGVEVDALPLRATLVDDGLPDCTVCGVAAVEFHHWAPRAIFPDWPDVGVYLCKHHHDEWHARMRAHGLRWPYELAEAT